MGTSSTRSRGLDYKAVTVRYIEDGLATCMDDFGHYETVPMDIQRTKGTMPEPNERWIIDKMFGVWTFAAIMAYEGPEDVVTSSDGGVEVFAAEVGARARVTAPTVQVGVSLSPASPRARASIDTPYLPAPAPAAVGGSGPAGMLVVAADGSGDYTTLTAALSFISGTGVDHWVIFVRGTTIEPGNISWSASALTLIGEGPDATIGGATRDFSFSVEPIAIESMQFSCANLAFFQVRAVNSKLTGTSTFYAFDLFVAATDITTTDMTVDGEFSMSGGALDADTIVANGPLNCNAHYSGSGAMVWDVEDRGYISGFMNRDMTIGGFRGVNFALVIQGPANELTLSAARCVGTITSSDTGPRLVVSGNDNKVLIGGLMTVTNTGSGNTFP